MKLTVVGSGTATPDAERVGSAFLVEAAGTVVLLDCGPGAVHHMARFGLPWARIDHILISHFHNDHTGDLPALLFGMKWGVAEPRTAPLSIAGPPGLRDRLRHMAGAFGDHVSDPGFHVRVAELEPGPFPLGHLDARCHPTRHADDALGFRLGDGSAVLGYTGDTGESEPLARFMDGVDLLIAECSVPDDQDMETHLTPTSLARMARIAAPKRLMVTHVYPALARHDVRALIRQAGWDGETVRARDGLEVLLGG